MPLSKRIIPCLDVDGERVVKGTHFKEMRDAGDPVRFAKKYRDEGADELVFLDIIASVKKRDILKELVMKVASELDIPFTVGGGLRSVDDVRQVLCSGADKSSVNTIAVENPDLLTDLADRFGSQCVVVAIDAKLTSQDPLKYEVYTHGARRPTGLDAVEWAKRAEELGAGEILLTSIDRDGTQNGYEIELTKLIARNVGIPVIASGGCGEPKHIYDVLTDGEADAALAASIFHYKRHAIPAVKTFLNELGVAVRL